MGLSKPLFSVFIFLFWMGSISKAQIDVGNLGKRVLKNTSKQVENGVENKAAEETLEQIDLLFNKRRKGRTSDSTSTSSSNSYGRNQGRAGRMIFAPNHQKISKCSELSDYTFQDDFTLQMTTTSGEGETESEVTMKCYVGNDHDAMAYKFEDMSGKGSEKVEGMIMIVDPTDSTSIMLMESDGSKIGFCSKGHDHIANVEKKEYDLVADGWTKTGRTENIAGSVCDEYEKKDSVTIQSVWVAANGAPVSELIETMKKNKQMGSMGSMMPFEKIMRMTNESFETGDVNRLEVLEYNKSSNQVISTSDYTFF